MSATLLLPSRFTVNEPVRGRVHTSQSVVSQLVVHISQSVERQSGLLHLTHHFFSSRFLHSFVLAVFLSASSLPHPLLVKIFVSSPVSQQLVSRRRHSSPTPSNRHEYGRPIRVSLASRLRAAGSPFRLVSVALFAVRFPRTEMLNP